jgi:hypothetical protein
MNDVVSIQNLLEAGAHDLQYACVLLNIAGTTALAIMVQKQIVLFAGREVGELNTGRVVVMTVHSLLVTQMPSIVEPFQQQNGGAQYGRARHSENIKRGAWSRREIEPVETNDIPRGVIIYDLARKIQLFQELF